MLKLRYWPRAIWGAMLGVVVPRRQAIRLALADTRARQWQEEYELLQGQLKDVRHNLELAEQQIEVRDLAIDETAVVVEHYRQRFEALSRIEAMKGQGRRNELPSIVAE